MKAGGDEVSVKELKKMIKKGDYRSTVGSNVSGLLQNNSNFKIFHGKSNTEDGAVWSAKKNAKSNGIQDNTPQAAQSKTVVRTVGGSYEVILIVPIR